MPMDYTDTMPLADLDASYLRDNYFTGFTFKDKNNQVVSDGFFEERLRDALGVLEQTVNIDVLKRFIVGEKHDYKINDYLQWAFCQLFRIPAQSVSEIRAQYPTGQTAVIYPKEWIRLDIDHSQIKLVPTFGTLGQVLIGHGSTFLPLIYGGHDNLPHLWEVDYVSGFDPDAVPRIIMTSIAKLAAIEILMNYSDLVRPLGVTSQSLSVDGLSQSRGYNIPAFRARIEGYNTDLYGPSRMGGGLIDQIRSSFLGFNIAAL